MKKKKLISRVLVFVTSTTLALTCLPPNLISFAAGGGAGGGFGGGGGSYAVADNPINDEDIGLRFSLVTKDASGTRVVPNIYGKYYTDVWDAGFFKNNATDWYGAVNSYTRYDQPATAENIKYFNDTTFDATITAAISASKKGSVNMDIASHLNPGGASINTFFTEGEGGLKINGNLFYNWFMADAGTYNGESHSRYYFIINAMYRGKLNGIDMNNTFLVVEPLVHLANPTNDGNFTLTGKEYVASWYGYTEGNLVNRRVEPGCSFTLRDRFSSLANNFQIKKTEHLTNEMETAMIDVLGVQIPGQFEITGGSSIAYGNASSDCIRGRNVWGSHIYNFSYRTQGYAMQIFWLKDMDDPSTPIDTYDIINQPQNTPSNPETPSKSDDEKVDTTGNKSIVKLYCDLYKDPVTGYYTQIENIIDPSDNDYAFIETDTSNRVTITNEEKINGYEVSAWYTSNTKYDPNSNNNDLLKASNMISTTNVNVNITDNSVSLKELGGNQFRVNQYQAAYTSSNKQGYNADGGQHYYAGLSVPHGANGQGLAVSNPNDSKNYTDYKRLEVKGDSNYGSYDYQINEDGTTVDLSDTENTIVILYTREKTYIPTNEIPNSDIPDNPDDRIDQSGNLTIVKLYGVINPNTYEITLDPSKSTVIANKATRNVNINSEPNYNFAEWIYVTGGSKTSLTSTEMGDPSHTSYDGNAEQAYRLDGFVDNFKNNPSLSSYFKFNGSFPEIHTISQNSVNSELTAGRYSIGSRSGIGSSYNSTIYFGGNGDLADETPDDTDTNDVLFKSKANKALFFCHFSRNVSRSRFLRMLILS